MGRPAVVEREPLRNPYAAHSLPLPYEVTESITAALRSHKSFTILGLKGIAEGQEFVGDDRRRPKNRTVSWPSAPVRNIRAQRHHLSAGARRVFDVQHRPRLEGTVIVIDRR